MSNLPPGSPPADFSNMIPQDGETNIDTPARRPAPGTLADTVPRTDPAADLADRVAALLDEPAVDRNRESFADQTQTDSGFASQSPAHDDNFAGQDHGSPQTVTEPAPSPDQGDGDGPAVHADSDSRGAVPDNSQDAEPQEPPASEPPPSPPDDDVSLDNLAESILGRPATRDEKIGIARLYHDAMKLPEERRHELARVMGYVDDPQPQPTTHEPPAPSTPSPGTEVPPDEDDPYLAPHLRPLQQEVEQLRSTVSRLTEEQQQVQRATLAEQAQAAIDKFQTEHPYLTPDDIAEMQIQAGNEFALRYQQTGDMARATEDTFTSMLWTNPKYRERALSAQQERQQTTEDNEKLRQQRAASLAPGGAQVTRDENTAPTPPPKDRNDMRRAMRDELGPLMSQS